VHAEIGLIAVNAKPNLSGVVGQELAVNPSVLLVAAKWWPLSARMAIAFLKNGCSVSAICPMPHPITFVEGLDAVYRYSSSNSLASLRHAIDACRPHVVVPCDDGAASQCRALFESDVALRPLLQRSLGAFANYSILDSRFAFLNVAQGLGLLVPKTRRVSEAGDLLEWHNLEGSKAVLKADGDSGGNGVRICESPEQSLAAWKSLREAPSRATALKRIAIDREPLALWLRKRPREITVQEYIDGRPANIMVASWEGRVLALVSVVVVAAAGPTGAAMVVRFINDERMRHAAQVIAARLQLSGFFGLDFVIAKSTGRPYLIEINPRCTQLGHIELAGSRSLAGTFAAALRGESLPELVEPVSSQRVALFPGALTGGAKCRPYVEASYHDAPVGHARLVAELLREAWPRRQVISRLYHFFNRIKLPAPAVYEEVAPPEAVTGSVERLAVRSNSG
jgi:hypothetical protein